MQEGYGKSERAENRHRSGRDRLPFIDLARGTAVLLMLAFHTADGWLRPELRTGEVWLLIRTLGGLAAPLFLLVSGFSLSLTLHSSRPGGASRSSLIRACVCRGLQIALLGYLLRLQMWMLDGGAIFEPRSCTAALPLLGAYLLAYLGLGELKGKKSYLGAAALALSLPLFMAGLRLVEATEPARLAGLLRIDILQSIGACTVVVSAVAILSGGFDRRRHLCLWFGLGVMAATPAVRALVPGVLPEALAGYLAAWKVEPGVMPVTLFPLFPWVSYVFIGSWLGKVWLDREQLSTRPPFTTALFSTAALLALLGSELLAPANLLIEAAPVLTQPIRVAHRIGVALLITGAALLVCRVRPARLSPLAVIGRLSLPIYWIHLEFAYGVAAKSIAQQATFIQWLLALALLTCLATLLSWLLVGARDAWSFKTALAFPLRPR